MQLNKTSKKTANIAENAAKSVPETVSVPEVTAKPRTTRSSKTKNSEAIESASGKHHHKASSTPVSEPTTKSQQPSATPASGINSKALSDAPSRVIRHDQIAELAYSYWAERGCAHGSSEEDWLRAEKTLVASV